MSLSNYYENVLLDYIFSNTVYLGLSTANPDEDASGLAEPSGSGYARATVPASSWNDASAGSITNSAEITFAKATGSWGTVTYFAIFDAITGGNMLAYGALSVSKTILSTQIPKFVADSITVSLD